MDPDVTKMTKDEYVEYMTKNRDKLIRAYDDLIAVSDAAVYSAIAVLVVLIIIGLTFHAMYWLFS